MPLNNMDVTLAHYRPINQWSPVVGDLIIYHGWFQHWFGVVSQINIDGTVDIVKAGLPLLLFSMSQASMNKSKKTKDIAMINQSVGGKYAIMQQENNNIIWYI